MARAAVGAVALGLALLTVGCGGTVAVGSGGSYTPPAHYDYLSGNWQFDITPTAGQTSPFASFGGFLNEQSQQPGKYDVSTLVVQVPQGTSCYTGATVIPLSGNVQGDAASYSSFSVNGQYLSLKMTKADAATTLSGTFNDTGGCIKGVSGTITGTRYTPLTGTYAGNIGASTPAPTVALVTSQNIQGTGSGTTQVSGSATFTGFACFTKGSIVSTSSYVLGNEVVLTSTTNDPTGAQAIFTGTFDSGATTVTLTAVNITSGSCAGNYGASTLAKQ